MRTRPGHGFRLESGAFVAIRALLRALAGGLAATLLAVPAFAASGELAGSWTGVWIKSGDALPVALTFTKSGDRYSGSFESDALQVAQIPFRDIRDANGVVSFSLAGDATTTVFKGVVSASSFNGEFTEGTTKGRFALVRSALPAGPVRSRDVIFRDGDVVLSGSLLLPRSGGKHPAILFLQGSGAEGRWANVWLARKFVARGFVALVFDKRGVGGSTGDWKKAGFEALAEDAAAGIRLLRAEPEVDARRIGIYGHSQGGTIAPLVCLHAGGLAFVIASAASGTDPAATELYSVGNSIGARGLPPAERPDAERYVKAVIGVAYHGEDRAALDALATKFHHRSWFFAAPPPGDYYWSFSKAIADFRPAAYWRQVRAPVLLLYGARDDRVPPRESMEAIRAALAGAGNKNVTGKIYPGADHKFTIVTNSAKAGWPRHVPDYANSMIDWALAQAAAPD